MDVVIMFQKMSQVRDLFLVPQKYAGFHLNTSVTFLDQRTTSGKHFLTEESSQFSPSHFFLLIDLDLILILSWCP